MLAVKLSLPRQKKKLYLFYSNNVNKKSIYHHHFYQKVSGGNVHKDESLFLIPQG